MNTENLDKHRILLVEDEENLAIGLQYNLSAEGYIVELAKDGRAALTLFKDKKIDLIILDIMIPYIDGFEIAHRVRIKDPQMPILMLTARTTHEDKVKGLELGADDYITKPFHLDELLLRVRGMLKRKTWYKDVTTNEPVISFGKNKINFKNLACSNGDNDFKLTHQEAMVIKYLIENKGKIVSRKELLENVWHMNPDIETRTVDNFIARLRKYFEADPSNPAFIKSIRSAGYLFED